jgi:hypothetical protein
LAYLTTIWYILWPFGIFSGNLVIFFPVLVCCTEKYLATLAASFPMRGKKRIHPLEKIRLPPGLPDFSWYKIPKREKYT